MWEPSEADDSVEGRWGDWIELADEDDPSNHYWFNEATGEFGASVSGSEMVFEEGKCMG